MAAQYTSKHGVVSRSREELYMMFADLGNFSRMLPEDKKEMIHADYDTLKADVQGFSIGVRMRERLPYSLLSLEDDGAPFKFDVDLHFDEDAPGKTDFWIDIRADLNLMMKMMLGSKLQEAIDKMVDAIVDISDGRVPEGIDPSSFTR